MAATSDFPTNLDIILDVPVKLTVELGSCQMPMRDVLRLTTGSVVQLDKVADAPVDLFVNQKLVARGEVVRRRGSIRHQNHRGHRRRLVIRTLLQLAVVALWGFALDIRLRAAPAPGGATNLANLAGLDSPIAGAGTSLLRMLGALILVLALFGLAVWCVRHSQRLGLRAQAPSPAAGARGALAELPAFRST